MSDQKPHSLVSKSQGKKGNDYVHSEEHSSEGLGDKRTEASCQPGDSSEFSKLLEGVTFVLSGVVNPERNNLRSKALSMGAHYQPDWASDCSLLICAFPNTPKFRQVETDGGTIVSKDWINECYNQKKLVEIEKFLMHVGRPWRRSDSYSRDNQGNRMPEEVSENIKRRSHHKIGGSSRSEPGGRGRALDQFSPSKLKGLALKDLTETVLWLEKQEEKSQMISGLLLQKGLSLVCRMPLKLLSVTRKSNQWLTSGCLFPKWSTCWLTWRRERVEE
ncbi:BRCT domain-containing DNA repair protein isoform X2 [Wolffia australiana]